MMYRNKFKKKERYFRIAEFARIVGCTRANIYDLIYRKVLIPSRVFGIRAISLDEAKRFLVDREKYRNFVRTKYTIEQLKEFGLEFLKE